MMKKWIFFLLWIPILSVSYARDLRMVSLSPSVTELLISIGAEHNLVGMTDSEFADKSFQAATQNIAQVGRYGEAPNISQIVKLHPDVVLMSHHPQSFEEFNQQLLTPLGAAGIPLLIVPETTLSALPDLLINLSHLVGNPRLAQQQATQWKTATEEYQQKYPHPNIRPILIRISRGPDWYATNRSFVSEIFELCGGKNVLVNDKASYMTLGKDALLAKKPVIIFDLSPQDETEKSTRDNHVITYHLPSDIFLRYGPKTAEAVGLACYKINQAPM